MLTRGDYSDVLHPGDHGSTFAGNPVICAGGCVVLKNLTAPGVLTRIEQKGNEIMEKLRAAVDEMEVVTDRDHWPVPTYNDMLFYV